MLFHRTRRVQGVIPAVWQNLLDSDSLLRPVVIHMIYSNDVLLAFAPIERNRRRVINGTLQEQGEQCIRIAGNQSYVESTVYGLSK